MVAVTLDTVVGLTVGVFVGLADAPVLRASLWWSEAESIARRDEAALGVPHPTDPGRGAMSCHPDSPVLHMSSDDV